jgi:hypothetical protein
LHSLLGGVRLVVTWTIPAIINCTVFRQYIILL